MLTRHNFSPLVRNIHNFLHFFHTFIAEDKNYPYAVFEHKIMFLLNQLVRKCFSCSYALITTFNVVQIVINHTMAPTFIFITVSNCGKTRTFLSKQPHDCRHDRCSFDNEYTGSGALILAWQQAHLSGALRDELFIEQEFDLASKSSRDGQILVRDL